MKTRFIAHYDEPLSDAGFAGYEERIAETDPKQTVKGAFFDDLVKILGPDIDSIRDSLIAKERAGRYLPFQSYPLRDHAVLAYHAAKKLHPALPMRESLRRLHRGNLEAFTRTMLGKMIVAMTSDPKEDYARIEEAFEVGRDCGTVNVRRIEERAIEVRFEHADPWLDCSELGTLEGMGRFFGKTFRIEVELDSNVDGSFVCRFRD